MDINETEKWSAEIEDRAESKRVEAVESREVVIDISQLS